ncbi:MAG: glutathione S-transferase family protein [Gammaproteobacteria bacterium]|jgi:glutathionyl-hydroquinone reductase|nr:glutathione S-transferase family protein [Gammaproteobacteria bacterium]
MGLLIEGVWDADATMIPLEAGRFVREPAKFRGTVTADGASGFAAEPGRYHLYVAYHCPWAWRTILYRRLKRLESVISMTVAIPNDRHEGWIFGDYPGGCAPDEVNGFTHLHQAYTAAMPRYSGTVSVPVLWDKRTRTIVNNESSEIIRMLNSAFDAFTDAREDYYPEALRAEIDLVNQRVYDGVNNGVYRVGLARSQAAYDEAFDLLFDTLDWLDARLAHQRYLVGERITEADWRLLASLLRFDLVYHALFKCNQRSIASYPQLSNYLRDLYQVPGVAETVNVPHFVRGYYSIPHVNPNGIIPRGPKYYEAWLASPHDRTRFARSAA